MRYEDYIKMDSSFDEAYFKTRVVNTFVKYYTAVMLNELDNVKHFITEEDKNNLGEVRTCPHCGHNMDINNSGKCSYCGGIYDLDEYDWILSSIKEAPNVIYSYGDSIIE